MYVNGLTRIVGLVADDADPLQVLELGGKFPAPRGRRAQAEQLLPGVPDDALVEDELGQGPTLDAISAFASRTSRAARAARSAVTGRTSPAAGTARGGVRGSDALGQIGKAAAGPARVAAGAAVPSSAGAKGGLAQAVGAAAIRSLVGAAGAGSLVVVEGQSGEMIDVRFLGLAAAADLTPAFFIGGMRARPDARGRTSGGNLRGGLCSRRWLKAFPAAA